MKNKKSRKKKNKISEHEAANLFYYETLHIIPRLNKLKKITISIPAGETYDSWIEKLGFISKSLEKRISNDFYDLDVASQLKAKEEADKAAKMLGEFWFDLWS